MRDISFPVGTSAVDIIHATGWTITFREPTPRERLRDGLRHLLSLKRYAEEYPADFYAVYGRLRP